MRWVVATYGLLGLLLWPVPLLNVLHVESAAVVAFVAFFTSGWAALARFASGVDAPAHVLARQEAALVVPLAMLTLSMLWAPNCGYLQGLLFYALFPGISVVLGVAMAYALNAAGPKHPRLVLGFVGGAIVLGGPLYDLGLHPQLYTYNHVFGGVLGPLYDEQLAVRTGLFAFRGLTLLWAVLTLLVGLRLRGRGGVGVRVGIPFVALLIGTAYLFSARLGFNTPAWYIQEQLGGHVRTAHFDIYYDPASVAPDAAARLAEDHEYHYAWLADRMAMTEAERPPRVESYLYPDPDTKARLTGARYTSVAPVWLATPQSHLRLTAYEESFGHELAHLFGRPFGLPGLKASWAVGLVEGWAVALEPPDGRPSPHDQVAVAARADSAGGLGPSLARDLAARLSPLGFWTGRGAVSYTTMGSFVRFLLDRYGPGPLKAVYARANFESAYGRSLPALADEWVRFLQGQPLVARSAHDLVTARFAQPSLFEKRCPHYVPPYERAYQQAEAALGRRDTAAAVRHLTAALQAAPQYVPAHVALARVRLARRQPDLVITQLDTLADRLHSATVLFALADAYALQGKAEAARRHYAATLHRVPRYQHAARAQVMLRDAVASRPSVVRILTSPDSARVQARRLGAMPAADGAVRAWQALRLLEAQAFAAAAPLWPQLETPLVPDRPVAWRRTWDLQQRVWVAHTAYRIEAWDQAYTQATAAARAFRAYGDVETAARLEAFARRCRWVETRTARRPSDRGGADHTAFVPDMSARYFTGRDRAERG